MDIACRTCISVVLVVAALLAETVGTPGGTCSRSTCILRTHTFGTLASMSKSMGMHIYIRSNQAVVFETSFVPPIHRGNESIIVVASKNV